ncbi:hypothetical protein A3218_21815 [Pseudomonas chlororaphis]|nr:hypothetical protein A3218_21815 [Pseudomonas chlororaphis]
MLSHRGINFFNNPRWFGIIDLTGSFDQFRLPFGLTDDEPGVDGNTMPPHAGTWLQDIDSRMSVSQLDEFPHIYTELIADHRKLIGKRDIDITKAILGQLAHFRCARIGKNALTFYKQLVKTGSDLRTLRCHTTNNPIILHQLTQHMARQYAFRAMSNSNIRCLAMSLREGQVRTHLGQPLRHLLGCPYRRSGFENNQVTLF